MDRFKVRCVLRNSKAKFRNVLTCGHYFNDQAFALYSTENYFLENFFSEASFFVFRKVKAKKRGAVDATMAFRGAYGQLSLLRSFLKKGK